MSPWQLVTMAAEEVDASLRSFGLKIWSPHQDDSEDVTNQIMLIVESGLWTGRPRAHKYNAHPCKILFLNSD